MSCVCGALVRMFYVLIQTHGKGIQSFICQVNMCCLMKKVDQLFGGLEISVIPICGAGAVTYDLSGPCLVAWDITHGVMWDSLAPDNM